MITITPLGGFFEVGRNSVALEYNNKIIILDMGFHLERFIELTEDDIPHKKHSVRKLVAKGAFPDIRNLRRRRNDVVGIICSHAHLDHVGAVPFLAKYFSCPVYGTPFTTSVIKLLCEDKQTKPQLITQEVGSTITFDHGISVEFIRVSHSTPQSSILAIHTPEGTIIYGNDYKNDQTPPHEEATDLNRLKELKGKVNLLMLDCLYAAYDEHAPSEQQVRDELLELDLSDYRAIIATTFSSNISRLITLCDIADKLGRKVVFLGRSLAKYIQAAADINLVDLEKRGEVIKYSREVAKFLKRMHSPERYLIITTGHQGEPQAVLGRMVQGLFSFHPQDLVLFSSKIIPTDINKKHRRQLEEKLSRVQIIKDKHVSGHAAGKDHDELIRILEPRQLAPSHGTQDMMEAFKKRSMKLGYQEKDIFFLKVGERHQF
ncbi:MAG: MBL fold metallo-hydrolase [Nanoarchaeota archaeon]|nr:MBL fold metallo-hydrolase [Nanoarchaeota archaeon]